MILIQQRKIENGFKEFKLKKYNAIETLIKGYL